MLTGERMTQPPITIRKDVGVGDALRIMHDNEIRRLPVVDGKGRLIGIVSEKDLLHASPSPVTSLSVWEIHYLLSKLTVSEIMSSPVITVGEHAPLEEAARIMVDNRIGGIPVMRGENLVGMITETDVFKVFLEMLGARMEGVRLSLLVPGVEGVLAKITSAIAALGGNIISLGTFYGGDTDTAEITVKVQGLGQEALLTAVQDFALEILDVREV